MVELNPELWVPEHFRKHLRMLVERLPHRLATVLATAELQTQPRPAARMDDQSWLILYQDKPFARVNMTQHA